MVVSSTLRMILFLILISTGSVLADANYNSLTNNKKPVVCSAQQTRHQLTLSDFERTVQLRDLTPGSAYRIYLQAGSERLECDLSLLSADHVVLRRLSTDAWMFTASAWQHNFNIESKDCTADQWFTFSVGEAKAQSHRMPMQGISIDTDIYTVEELIEEVFIGGDCFQVEPGSIEYSGDELSVGYFSTGTASISIEEGIILSTGEAMDAAGPNNIYNTGSSVFGVSDDDDIIQLLGNNFNLRDRAAIEFDFTPTSDQVSFEFVFASEEYCEYVNSDFNDAFGFFISGPGINGPFSNNAENIAFVPGTNDYMAINSVNHLINQDHFNNNVPFEHHALMPGVLGCPGLITEPAVAENTLEFDGFTNVMTAMAAVVPCETYHIKLVISDVGDAYFDSAVFLKANSFNAGGSALVSTDVPGFEDGIITEDCVDGYFRFTRTNEEMDEPVTIHFDVLPSSTATAGVDYEPLPDSIVIPAGAMYYDLPVQAIPDQEDEGIENIVLELDVPCSCDIPFSTIQINDIAPLEVLPDEVTVCVGDTAALVPIITGGVGTLTYAWNTGDTLPNIQMATNESGIFTLTVTDQCGKTVDTDYTINVLELPTGVLSGTAILCNSVDENVLPATLTGGGPWTIQYMIDEVLQSPITGITTETFNLPVNQIGQYELVGVQNQACEGTAAGMGEVTEVNIDLSVMDEPMSCPGANDGSLTVTPAGGLPPYTYVWSNNTTAAQATGLEVGTYEATVSDQNGCFAEVTAMVVLDGGVPEPDIEPADVLTCDKTAITLTGTINTAATYQYLWTTNDGQITTGANGLTPEVTEPGEYIFAVTNMTTGCQQSDTVIVTQNITPPEPVVFIQGPQTLTCTETSTILDATGSQPFGNVDFLWSSADGDVDPVDANLPLPEITAPGLYQLELTNLDNGCTAAENILIDINVEVPTVNLATPEILTCANTTTVIDATTSSTGDMMEYHWSDQTGNDLNVNFPALTVENPGMYQLEILNTDNGCSGDGQMEVLQDVALPIVQIDVVPENLDCDTETMFLNANGSSQGDVFIYNWNTEGGHILNGATALTPEIDAPGTYQLVVTNTENGCVSSSAVQVDEDVAIPILSLEIMGINVLTCYDTLSSIGFTSDLPAAQITFEWAAANGGVIAAPTATTQSVNQAGTYAVTITDNTNGCTNQASVTVESDQMVPHAALATPEILTCDAAYVLIDGTASDTSEYIVYEWTAGHVQPIPDEYTRTTYVHDGNDYTLHVINVRNGCRDSATVTVLEDYQPPLAELIPATEMLDCNTPTLSVAALHTDSLHYQFDWNTVDGNILNNENGMTITVNQGGTYELIVTDAQNGCTATATTPIIADEDIPTNLNLEAIPAPCYGAVGALNILSVDGGEAPYLYAVLELGESYYPDTVYAQLAPGNYTVQVQDINGCIYQENILVSEPPPLQVSVQPEYTIPLGATQELLATVNVPDFQVDSLIWNPVIDTVCQKCYTIDVRPFDNTTYSVMAIDENGCVAEAQTLVIVDKERHVYIPNAFSPNADGANDEWMVYTDQLSVAKINTLQIFNRWGEKVFENNDFLPNVDGEGWSGDFKGQEAMSGVYVYFVEIEFVDGAVAFYEGDVTLVR